ncbi:MAG TPA: RnfABCDGE type electron transport complex subunit D [Rhodothermales bacterium]|nr:RnfABCDGE type electron transport complex subunit D [Rhodothermales bacterium]
MSTLTTNTSTTAETKPKTPPQRRWGIRYDRRYTAPLLVTLILLGAHLSFGILESYEKTLLAIAASVATELVLSRIFRGKWPHLASAYISGISVGILIRSPLYWPYALCSMISITSKYAINVKGRHIWNPSNLGICAMLFLAPFAVAPLSVQWGNNLWPMLAIWVIGSVSIWRLRRFHICATYVAGFFLFAWLRTLLTGEPFLTEISPITGPMYQLFVFFMITDPKTTVKSKTGQIVVAFLVAFVEFFFRLGESVYAPFYALFLVGPAAMLLEMWWNARKEEKLAAA